MWSDPCRSTILFVIADWDNIKPDQILAWGREAERCLGHVEVALDDDELWA